jgi:hypothetical protein
MTMMRSLVVAAFVSMAAAAHARQTDVDVERRSLGRDRFG